MKHRVEKMGIVVLIVVLLYSTIYAKELSVKDLGTYTEKYKLQFEGSQAMLSREGAEAKKVKKGTVITDYGRYYLTVKTSKGIVIQTFKIKPKKDQNVWRINSPSKLDEILTYSMQNVKKDIVIYIKKSHYTKQQIGKLLKVSMERSINTYPMIPMGSYGSSYAVSDAGDGYLKVKVHFGYVLQDTQMIKKYMSDAQQWMIKTLKAKVSPDMKDYEREFALTKTVIDELTYSKTATGATNATALSHTVAGAIKNKRAVCDGYSKTLMYLLNACGVPCQMIQGKTSYGNGIDGHAWNLVFIGGAYYHVDATFADDELAFTGLYDYYNETDDYMRLDHEWNEKVYPSCQATSYVGLFLPNANQGVYEIKKADEIDKMLNQIKSTKRQAGTIILRNQSQHKWDTQMIIKRLSQTIGTLQYLEKEKYDSCVINFYKNKG